MNSTLLLLPIAAIAVYSVYRHVKKEMGDGGSGTCSDCPSKGKCGVDASTKTKHHC